MKNAFNFLPFIVILFLNDKNNRCLSSNSEARNYVGFVATSLDPAAEIVHNQESRVKDKYGDGQYGASRDKGTRIHKGIDIIVQPEEKIYAPFDGDIVRQAVPYKDDIYSGIVLKGSGEWLAHEIKIFYVDGELSGHVIKGQEIGKAQNLTIKYPGITNHIHFEVKVADEQIDPFEIWKYSF
jgi:leukocyte cell-derived chemotaxin-2